ncbi:hypothetical protein ANMWB30_09440 [Arthrobacter sp. MWB30]|nr:hypothetical protein ANMWB30_09440 [Arthrobacter sp. MWB30]
MTTFIHAANGLRLNIAGVKKLYLKTVTNDGTAGAGGDARQGVFADEHLIGFPATDHSPRMLLENLAARICGTDGVFGIEDGGVFHQFISDADTVEVINFGAQENSSWDGRTTFGRVIDTAALMKAPESVSALQTMVRKLNERGQESRGYVTGIPEIQQILSELTALVPASVGRTNLSGSADDVSVEITIGFTLERGQL